MITPFWPIQGADINTTDVGSVWNLARFTVSKNNKRVSIFYDDRMMLGPYWEVYWGDLMSEPERFSEGNEQEMMRFIADILDSEYLEPYNTQI